MFDALTVKTRGQRLIRQIGNMAVCLRYPGIIPISVYRFSIVSLKLFLVPVRIPVRQLIDDNV